MTSFSTIPEALAEIRAGRMLIVVDDEHRENEGDLLMAAEKVTPEAVNFMARFGRGLICLPMTAERLCELNLPDMVEKGGDHMGTAFTISVDAKKNVTTGISAYERAETIRTLINPATKPEDLVRPGHIFPLRAKPGGVLRRPGHTEAAVDLARMAGLAPAGVICEIMNEDGSMARVPELLKFAGEHGLKIITIADLIRYRLDSESLIDPIPPVRMPTKYGLFTAHAFEEKHTGLVHVALVMGKVDDGEPVLCRVHSECLTGDVFHSLRCDCGEQFAAAMSQIAREGRGVLLYMRQEGRGIGLANKLRAYALQDQGADTVEANVALGFAPDARDYGTGAQILRHLGVRQLRLLTNNPRKQFSLQGYGLAISDRVTIEMVPNAENRKYLETKRTKLGHMIGKD
ncbi:MAG TPA: bifunctional 3,4-dihydroxy-2-butanone-4-phosphate synthase/GTP cyclohydrolase II [Symbiobacteriaceae bacterium]|nr:bifunctional 3,4-dihydroxy-2-butanone-4-phosphate synthase/GTP cyclohydrolase II [Symbiobacteriaceae bacterium]